jgi:hypothetical protein
MQAIGIHYSCWSEMTTAAAPLMAVVNAKDGKNSGPRVSHKREFKNWHAARRLACQRMADGDLDSQS